MTSFFTVVPIQTKKPHGFNVTWVLSEASMGQYPIIVSILLCGHSYDLWGDVKHTIKNKIRRI